MAYLLALDAGTTSARALLFDEQGRLISQAQHEITQYYPQPGWVEHDPKELLSIQLATLTEVQFKAGIYTDQIAALGITNQRETTILWNKRTGEPVYNAIVWQCRRTAPYLEKLQKEREDLPELVASKTGLVLDPYFSASKIRWILDNVPAAQEALAAGELAFGTVDSWLMYQLSGRKVHKTDYTNAARTMLFNIHTLTWDDELLEIFGIPKEILPEVCPSISHFTDTATHVTAHPLPIWGVAGDQQSSLFGHCCFQPGSVKNTYGTGCFILMNTGEKPVASQNGLITTLALGEDGKLSYALEGSVFIAGALIQWFRDELGILKHANLSEKLALSCEDNGGVYVVPAFSGLGAPYWNPDARGMICGLTRGTSKAQLVRAALESLAYQSVDIIDAMQADSGLKLTHLSVDGGASHNNFLMQFQADLLACSLQRPELIETTGLGAAYLAGLGAGVWDSTSDFAQCRSLERVFEPSLPAEKRYALKAQWRRAIQAVMTFARG